jgi:hypothetical protein
MKSQEGSDQGSAGCHDHRETDAQCSLDLSIQRILEEALMTCKKNREQNTSETHLYPT